MLLTITTTHRPATDIGFLLHKNPTRCQEAELAVGKAHMFYPEATEERCTFALVLDIDPIVLVRGGENKDGGLLDQYVNDRPYATSSFLSVAIATTLRSALNGLCKQRPNLVDQIFPIEATITPLPVRGGLELISRLFAPLGYEIEVRPIALDEAFPEWGASPYVRLTLKARCRVMDLLCHLYVLIPVLDLKKHYFIEAGEVEKLLAKGGTWLPLHPDRDLIARRYLRRKRSLAAEAIARLAEADDEADEEEAAETATTEPQGEAVDEKPKDAAEERLEKPLRLHEHRLNTVVETLKSLGARRVLDLGCGSGKLLKRFLREKQFTEIVGMDIGSRDLERAAWRLRLETLPERQKNRIKLIQGALTYLDKRLEGYDAAALVEVIEHIDLDRLASVERALFEFARPAAIIVTTPNRDYNVKFEGLPQGQFRHADHRFEWTRAEFQTWVGHVCEVFGYRARIEPLGEIDAEFGAPSQMAVFERGLHE
ncbi:MAG: 3' terminal RNA ribose 2'-O-methyltransferase Hen1 [Rhodomicrobium sp.]